MRYIKGEIEYEDLSETEKWSVDNSDDLFVKQESFVKVSRDKESIKFRVAKEG